MRALNGVRIGTHERPGGERACRHTWVGFRFPGRIGRDDPGKGVQMPGVVEDCT